MSTNQASFPIAAMARVLGVSEAGYYAWRLASPSERSRTDADLIALMRKIHKDLRGNPGVRRMRAELAVMGHKLGHKRVWRLMKAAGLRGRHPHPPEPAARTRLGRRAQDPRPLTPSLAGGRTAATSA